MEGSCFVRQKKVGGSNPWKNLRLEAAKKKTKKEKKQLILDFFKNQVKPQKGDIMIVSRNNTNSFLEDPDKENFDKSHTTMVEKVDTSGDGAFIYTIEGNSGDRVRGQKYDLLQTAGFHSLASIVNISRMSLASHGISTSLRTKEEIPALPADKQKEVYSRDDMVKPLEEMNGMLFGLAGEVDEKKVINPQGKSVSDILLIKDDKKSNKVD